MSDRNDAASMEKSREVIKALFQPIQTKIDAMAYHVAGGYSVYMTDFAAAFRDYHAAPGKGVKVWVTLHFI